MKTFTKQLWIALLLIAAGFQITAAQTLDPQPPRNLSAQVSTGPNGGSVFLKWQSYGAKPDGFNIFSAFNDVQGTVVFKIAGSILTQNDSSGWYFYTMPVYTTGTYSIYVTAFGNKKESDPSTVVRVDYKANILPQTIFQFQSTGSWLGTKNLLYSYDANVQMRTSTNTLVDVPEDGKSVKYSLAKEPQGMTIDAQTGKIAWMPTANGEYNVYVMASIQFQGAQSTISQVLQISVRNCARVTTIAGYVHDESGVAIEKGYVIITNTQASDSLNRRQVYTAAIRSGFYKITVDEGTFYLQANSGEFEPEWYQDSPTQEKSTPVNITCGDSVMANFIVKRNPVPQLYTLRGMVTDKVTGQPIRNAIVEFTNPKSTRPNSSQYTATSDEKGNYAVQLPGDQSYVARCTEAGIFDPTTATWIVEYLPQYYNEVSILTEATLINPTDKNLQNINFPLIRKSYVRYKGQIHGNVLAKDGHQLLAKIIAFPVKDTRAEVYTTDSGIDGSFQFDNVATGSYVVFAIATQEAFVPGFYRDGMSATLSWGEATVINVGTQPDIPSYTITLDPLSAARGGKGRIRGTIGKSKGIMKGDTPLAADPLTGAMVYATDAQGTVYGYSWSDGNGTFETDNLQKGNYRLVACKVGYKDVTAEVEITDEAIPAVASVELEASGTSGVETESVTPNQINTFPNPAMKNVTVEFTGAGETLIAMYSSLGVQISNENLGTRDGGVQRHSITTDNLAPGTYFVKISTGSRVSMTRITVLK